jgi:glutathione synthase/RimK-type ligase-like ATP-grasp enzyme
LRCEECDPEISLFTSPANSSTLPDYATAFIAKHATRLGRLAALHPVHDANTIKNCRDKWRFAQFTAEHAIPTPQTLLFIGKARDDLGVFDRGSAVL